MLWVWIAIALGLLCTLVGMVATVKGTLVIGLLLAVATSVAFGAAAWFYGKDEGSLKKTRRLAGVVTSIVSAIILIPATYYMLQPPSPIGISPSRVDLVQLSDLPNNLKGYINLTVHNRGDDPQYSVWVKLVISSQTLRPETLDIDFPTMEELSLSLKAMLNMAIGTMCLGGKDTYKNPAFLCVIDKLGPRDMFIIKVTSHYPMGSSSPERIGHLSAFVVKFSDHPSQHFDQSEGQPTASSVDHTPPEPFNITSMVHFCPNITEVYTLPRSATCTPNSKHNFKAKD